MSFDTADLAAMQVDGTLVDVITHEMGHVIGIGTIWQHKNLLVGASTDNPRFQGNAAKKEYGVLKRTAPTAVPLENTGGPGTMNSHWRETVFRNELMSGFIAAPDNPLSRLTVASLQDLGHVVNLLTGSKATRRRPLGMARRRNHRQPIRPRRREGPLMNYAPLHRVCRS